MGIKNNFTIAIIIFCYLFLGFAPLQDNTVLIKDNMLITRSKGIAFLGSGITEQDAKVIARNDAKLKALEQAGIYLESHVTIINFVLVKDEIITFSGSILKTKVLNEKRKIINNMFAIEIAIEATIDLKLLNQRIKEIRENVSLSETFH